MQLSRLFELVYLLLDRKGMTADELAEHFEVSRRTIYRDVDTLAQAGVLTAVDYWKGDSYSSGNVHALIKSMAAYVRGK